MYLGPKGVQHIPTLGPKYKLYSYMDPLGRPGLGFRA